MIAGTKILSGYNFGASFIAAIMLINYLPLNKKNENANDI